MGGKLDTKVQSDPLRFVNAKIYTQADMDAALRNERERAARLADEFALRLRSVGSHLVAAGVEVLASEIRSGKDGNSDAE